MDEYEYKKGDWVRFMKNGRLMIGQVEYQTDSWISSYKELYTDQGVVRTDRVLEVRSAQ